jgi:hypothetical protein
MKYEGKFRMNGYSINTLKKIVTSVETINPMMHPSIPADTITKKASYM